MMNTPLFTIFSMIILLATAAMAAPTPTQERTGGAAHRATADAFDSWLYAIAKRYVNDPSAGSNLSPAAWGGIIGGTIGVLLLVAILICCGRNRRFPATSGKGGSKGSKSTSSASWPRSRY